MRDSSVSQSIENSFLKWFMPSTSRVDFVRYILTLKTPSFSSISMVRSYSVLSIPFAFLVCFMLFPGLFLSFKQILKFVFIFFIFAQNYLQAAHIILFSILNEPDLNSLPLKEEVRRSYVATLNTQNVASLGRLK